MRRGSKIWDQEEASPSNLGLSLFAHLPGPGHGREWVDAGLQILVDLPCAPFEVDIDRSRLSAQQPVAVHIDPFFFAVLCPANDSATPVPEQAAGPVHGLCQADGHSLHQGHLASNMTCLLVVKLKPLAPLGAQPLLRKLSVVAMQRYVFRNCPKELQVMYPGKFPCPHYQSVVAGDVVCIQCWSFVKRSFSELRAVCIGIPQYTPADTTDRRASLALLCRYLHARSALLQKGFDPRLPISFVHLILLTLANSILGVQRTPFVAQRPVGFRRWSARREPMEEIVAAIQQASRAALCQELVVPLVVATEGVCHLPTTVHGIRIRSPKECHAVDSNHCQRESRVGAQRRASNRFQLPPISKEQRVHTSEHPPTIIGAELVATFPADDLADKVLSLTYKLSRQHAHLVNQYESQALAPRAQFGEVSGSSGACCLADRDTGPMVDGQPPNGRGH